MGIKDDLDAPRVLHDGAKRCQDCGKCASVCEVLFALSPLTPGTIVRQAARGELEPRAQWFIPRCDLCGSCSNVCPEGIDIPMMVVAARSFMINAGLIDPEQYRAMWIDHDWNAITLYRDTYKIDISELEKEEARVIFMPGCSLLNEAIEIIPDIINWLSDAEGVKVGLISDCCGMPLYEMGLLERQKRYEDLLWNKIHQIEASKLVLACPNCMAGLVERGVREGIKVQSLYELMLDAGLCAPVCGNDVISVHDSCPARNTKMGEWIRSILADYTIVEMLHHGDRSLCCGSGGAVSMFDYLTREIRAEKRVEEFLKTGANLCITYCMSSCSTLTIPNAQNRVRHVLELVFGRFVDHAEYQQKSQDMWHSEWGAYNNRRLQDSRLFTEEKE